MGMSGGCGLWPGTGFQKVGAYDEDTLHTCPIIGHVSFIVLVYNFDHGTKRYGLSMDKAKIVFFNNLSKEEINISYVSSNCFKVMHLSMFLVEPLYSNTLK